jgi:formylglycine-generating enzyme required for sulfatase activity
MFWMGCNEAVDNECNPDEKPYHEVNLDAFEIDKYEVTAGEYKACVDAGSCTATNASTGSACNYGVSGKESHPIDCVHWDKAKAYCEWAGKRLPTEAEWEKAARGTDGRKYPWGNDSPDCEHAVMEDSSAGGNGCGTGGTMPVGSKPKGVSPYGAEDMVGNVWEWVGDWYDWSYYASSPKDNPKGPGSGEDRVWRGGSWLYSRPGDLRASRRAWYGPGDWWFCGGFRCAWSSR